MIIINHISKDGKEFSEEEMEKLIEPLLNCCRADYWTVYSEESKGRVRDAIKIYHPKRPAPSPVLGLCNKTCRRE